MPFVKIDMIQEARELQELLKDDSKAALEFKEFEKKHIEMEKIKEQQLELRNKLVEIRKKKKITQKEIETMTGLSQQAISRIEISKDTIPNLSNLLIYANAIGIDFVKYLDMELANN